MRIRHWLGTLLSTSLLAGTALAQSTMTIVVPYPAGGTTDVIARSLQQDLQAEFTVPVIVENKPGAAGMIAVRHVAQATPDGYTLLLSNNGPSVAGPLMQPDGGIDPLTSLLPVAQLTRSPMMFMVHPSVPADDIAGFIAYARAQPNPVAYGSAGQGSYGHLFSEMFARSAKIDMMHVPYRGVAPTTTALVAGEVPLLASTFSQVMQGLIQEGRVKLLAVGSAEPSPLMPNVPVVGDTLPGLVGEAWFGIQAPAGTPPEMIERLNRVLVQAIQRPETVERMAQAGMVVEGSTPQAFGQVLQREVDNLKPIITDLGLIER